MLEPCEGKLSCTVLRGKRNRKVPDLPDQSWSINNDPPRERVTLRGNIILNYEDPNQPFRGTLQGIGCFDGPYIDWVVENNLVAVDHWHGISLYGAKNSRIINNTVIDLNKQSPGPPWVGFFDHKNGTPCENCIVRNNITSKVMVSGNTIQDHNYILKDYNLIFVDYQKFDYHLKSDAPVINKGNTDLAPGIDLDKKERSKNQNDIGAYQY